MNLKPGDSIRFFGSYPHGTFTVTKVNSDTKTITFTKPGKPSYRGTCTYTACYKVDNDE